jgi:hypothetical protein
MKNNYSKIYSFPHFIINYFLSVSFSSFLPHVLLCKTSTHKNISKYAYYHYCYYYYSYNIKNASQCSKLSLIFGPVFPIELETNNKNKNIRDLYKGISEFKRGTSLELM